MGWVVNDTPRPLYPWERDRRLGEPQGQSVLVPKISPSPEFESQTVQGVASHCTDHAFTSIKIKHDFIEGPKIY